MSLSHVNATHTCKHTIPITFIDIHLEKLELDAAVSRDVRQRHLVERRQQQLHVREERFQLQLVVAAQGRVQTRIQARRLQWGSLVNMQMQQLHIAHERT